MPDTSLLNDFATLFAYSWYRDFPMDGYSRDMGSTSDWNIHTGYTVRRVADLMGYFAHFESSNRTDAVIRDTLRAAVVFAEWEWLSPCENRINEPKKLSDAAMTENPRFCFLFSYAPTGTIERQLDYISGHWQADVPLLISLVEFEGTSKRFFKGMSMHRLHDGTWQLLREQRALAWDVPGTRWA
ncbi:hypothetical protein CCU68_25080 [Pseudomonas gingeri NCPPB 3146 = LMG 5327]|uniref:Uncharacterized protein n=2 Tax=Pseudomonas gingeri TaxID=117681 RepID=A0A7Y7XW15_9PSED|nr:hypothetical protein [Pseudomonas gingeri]NWC13314.1 hypothetical protein [Pseudomonas gingeri]PNQ89730.1 hypothetical protein CCU68_25080 [Pseudomonas gingeri NCPPB 3146 = LMG 5327]